MSSLTPNFGLYMPDPTDPYGDFISEHNNNMLIIDGNLGGGGGGGGGNTYGAFVDTSRLIYSGTYSTNLSYTATEDCFVWFAIPIASNTSAKAYIDGVQVATFWNGTASILTDSKAFYLKQGQTLTAQATNSSSAGYNVYGLVEGTNGIYTPIIYSDNERCIGVWRNNKPLYQAVLEITQSTSLTANTWVKTEFNRDSKEELVKVVAIVSGTGAVIEALSGGFIDGKIALNSSRAVGLGPADSARLVVQYTKSTDSAGSGNWNTDGVPTVHYSTNEEVIGTYLGKPLYQRTWDSLSVTVLANTTIWQDTGISSNTMAKIVDCKCLDTYGQFFSGQAVFLTGLGTVGIAFQCHAQRTIEQITLQYTKSTD